MCSAPLRQRHGPPSLVRDQLGLRMIPHLMHPFPVLRHPTCPFDRLQRLLGAIGLEPPMSLQELRQEAQQDCHPQRTIQRGGVCLIFLAPLLRHLVEHRKEGIGSIGLILEKRVQLLLCERGTTSRPVLARHSASSSSPAALRQLRVNAHQLRSELLASRDKNPGAHTLQVTSGLRVTLNKVPHVAITA